MADFMPCHHRFELDGLDVYYACTAHERRVDKSLQHKLDAAAAMASLGIKPWRPFGNL